MAAIQTSFTDSFKCHHHSEASELNTVDWCCECTVLIWVDNSTALSMLFHRVPWLTLSQLEINPLPQKLTYFKGCSWDSQRITQHYTWQKGVFDGNTDWQPCVPSSAPEFAADLQWVTKCTIFIPLCLYLPIQQIKWLKLAFSLKVIGDGRGNSKIYALRAKYLKVLCPQGHKRP